MSITRYFKVTDQKIIETLRSHLKKITESHAKGNEFGKKHGFESEIPAAFRRWGLWDSHLSGFFCGRVEHAKRDDKEFWTIPKDGTTRPKKVKKSPVYAEYSQLCKEVNNDGEAMDEAVGFNRMTFFPSKPGLYYSLDENLLIFAMPEKCDEVKGAVEITNLEYKTITDKSEVEAE